jgi:hypothetical protein
LNILKLNLIEVNLRYIVIRVPIDVYITISNAQTSTKLLRLSDFQVSYPSTAGKAIKTNLHARHSAIVDKMSTDRGQ